MIAQQVWCDARLAALAESHRVVRPFPGYDPLRIAEVAVSPTGPGARPAEPSCSSGRCASVKRCGGSQRTARDATRLIRVLGAACRDRTDDLPLTRSTVPRPRPFGPVRQP